MQAETSPSNSIDVIGEPISRVDGYAKVTGGARYAGDQPIKNVAHAVAVTSTISYGRITSIDTKQAESLPGVLAVITHQNCPKMNSIDRDDKKLVGLTGQVMPVLQDDRIHYGGQYVALVVAETLAQAEQAARSVKVDYTADPPIMDAARPIGPLVKPKKVGRGEPPDTRRGDVDAAFASAAVKVQRRYTTPNEAHNPMEMHSTIAVWNGPRLTLYDSTQHVMGVRSVGAAILGMSPDDIRVISPFLGGGFGCKGSIWPNIPLAAIAAKQVGRPVKLMLARQQMFTQVGYRPRTLQDIALGADQHGKLVSISHDTISQTSDFDEWPEPSSKQTSFLYSCENVRTTQMMARVNAGTPCQMRAPGEASGTFALELAMDELAYAAGIDPLQLRILNYAEKDESENKPYSSKSLHQCYQQAAEKFGWANRSMAPRSHREGETLIGWGMATATYPTNVSPSAASVKLFPDGRALVTASTQELGTGTYTIMTQIAAQTLGLPMEKVKFELGDSTMPKAPVSGGSQSAASVGNAVAAAAKAAIGKLASLATGDEKSPLHGRDVADIELREARLQLKDSSYIGETITHLLARNGNKPVEATAEVAPPKDSKSFSRHAFGAQFAEVRVNERLGEVRVSRVVGAFAAGRILNTKTARSQIMGAMVMGIGMALHEQTVYDPHSGRVVNDNLADYLVPVNSDIPPVEVIFVDEVDLHVNALGIKGIGELGITGIAAAVVNAVYHATGKRIRDLPVRVDTLMQQV